MGGFFCCPALSSNLNNYRLKAFKHESGEYPQRSLIDRSRSSGVLLVGGYPWVAKKAVVKNHTCGHSQLLINFLFLFSMLNDYDCQRDRSIDCISKRMLLIVVVFGPDGSVQFSKMGKIKGMFNN